MLRLCLQPTARQQRIVAVLFFSFLFTITHAQQSIRGVIVDGQNKGVVNANVLLLNAKDSLMVKGTITSKEGAYSFDHVGSGKYIIVATHTGREKVFSPSFSIVDKPETATIEPMQLLEKSEELNVVTVAARKPLFEQKMDRMVVNVANSITSAGSTALEVLERSPGVLVDRQNSTVSMNGKDGVVVMINGKINRMPITAVVQMLASMTADNIEKIELITTPPANFDAEGNAGYINIVLKENTNYGTNGSYSITGGYSKGETTEGSININHRKGKVNVYGDYSITRSRTQQEFSFYHKVLYNNKTTESYSQANRRIVNLFNNGRLGIDYELNKKTVVGALVSAYDSRIMIRSSNPGSVSVNQITDSIFVLSNRETNDWFNYSANANLQHSFSADEKLTVNLDFIHYKDNNPVDYANTYYNGNNSFLYDQQIRSRKKTPIDVVVGAFDYTKKLSKKADLEMGLKSTRSTFHNDVSVDWLLQNGWKRDEGLSAKYDLRESIYAAYASLSFTASEKTSFKTGLRWEYTNSNLGSEAQKNLVDRHYGRLFPSLFLSHKLNQDNSFNVSYSRRITRPTFNDMAPFVIFMDPYTFFSGNPGLQPSISDAGSFAYTYKRKVLSLTYSYDDAPITNFTPTVDPVTNKSTLASNNQRNTKTASVNLSLPFQFASWWNMQLNAIGNWQELNGYYKGEDIQFKKINASFTTTQSFKLPKEYSFELTGFYYTGGLFGIYKFKPIGALNIGMQKKLKDTKSSFRLNANNILNTIIAKPSVDLPDKNLIVSGRLVFAKPSFTLTFTHNFGNTKLKEVRNRSTGAEEEKGRVQQ